MKCSSLWAGATLACSLLLPPNITVQAASLTATKGTQPTSLSLSSEGAADWAHWGLNAATDWNHKSGITAKISNVTKLGTNARNRYTDGTMVNSWTLGTPTGSVSSTRAGTYTPGVGNGFQISVPADTTQRTLRIYCGLWKSQGKLEASLSDASAPAVVDTTHGSTTGSANTMFTIDYSAASAGQTLTVKWTVQTSHDTAGQGTVGWQAATLVEQSVDPCAGNTAPSVSLTSPASGAAYTAPATVPLAASASDTGGAVSKVEFFSGTTLVATDLSSPYSANWSSVAAGNYTLSAKATDNCSATATSSSVSIVVNSSSSSSTDPCAGNTAPSVSLTSPASGAAYTAPATVAMAATASDSGGSVTRVEFFSGTTLVATDTSSPYAGTWSSVAAGNYSLSARATDNCSATSTSSNVDIVVNASSSSSSSGSCGNGTGPTDNPIATKYGSTAYPWTGNIKWNCVYNVNNFSGADALAKYNAARDAAAANGGGVVYFPAGTYNFSQNLVMKSGVVIRGASTTASAKSGTSPGTLAPATVFVFPDKLHKGFQNNNATDSNYGVVNIDSDGGAIMFHPQLSGSSTSVYLKSWWTATDVVGCGKNKIVFGNRIRNVSYKYPNSTADSGNVYPYRFSQAVACYTDENCIVANNLLGKATRSGSTSVSLSAQTGCTSFSGSIPYPYDNRYGIDVNRNWFGGVINAYNAAGKANSRQLTPTSFPWLFRKGIVIRDNYIYMNGRVGLMVSGNGNGSTRGSGSQILSNHVEVMSNNTLYTVDGARCAGGQSTNENRGYDQTGFANNFDGNTGHINRQKVPSGYWTTDGEGLLHQDTNSSVGYQNLWNRNNLSGGQSGYMAYYKLHEVRDCTITGNTVNSGETLGVIGTSSTSGNVCSGNSKGCTNF